MIHAPASPSLPGRPLGRRALLAGGLAATGAALVRPAPAAALVIPVGHQIGCAIFREGKHIGQATYAFSQDPAALAVDILIDIHVKFGFVTVFRYHQTIAEHWTGDHLASFSSRTDDNGSAKWAQGRADGGAIQVTGSSVKPYAAPVDAVGTSYWNPRTRTAPMVNAKNGKFLHVNRVNAGPSQALLFDGQKVAADEWQFTGDVHCNVWYDAQNTWTGMQSFFSDGSLISFEKA